MPEPTAIRMAQRAAARRAREVKVDLRRGVNGLATIAATAALWGLAGTCWGMMHAFRGGSFSYGSLLDAIMTNFAGALLFNAWGLVLAVATTLAHRMATDRLAECETEMALAISLLPGALREKGHDHAAGQSTRVGRRTRSSAGDAHAVRDRDGAGDQPTRDTLR